MRVAPALRHDPRELSPIVGPCRLCRVRVLGELFEVETGRVIVERVAFVEKEHPRDLGEKRVVDDFREHADGLLFEVALLESLIIVQIPSSS